MLRSFTACVLLAVFLFASAKAQTNVPVASVAQLKTAIANAQPGHVITLAAGTYNMDVSKVSCNAAGTASQRITVRAASLGSVTVNWGVGVVEGFYVRGPYWKFENLVVQGTCSDHSNCEHSFHIVGNAEFTLIRNCKLVNFNAQIKGNGDGAGGYPDDVIIEKTELMDTAARATSNPVTKIDVVGGRRWIVRGNYIHDFQKGFPDHISYAAFLKGNSRNGIFERNLVVCSKAFSGGTRLGLSFGGGGTGPNSICEGGTCSIEHQNGIMRNNIIANCATCVYINEGRNSRLYNNIGYNCGNVDYRFTPSTGEARNNVVGGQIRDRDGATHVETNNKEAFAD